MEGQLKLLGHSLSFNFLLCVLSMRGEFKQSEEIMIPEIKTRKI